MSLDPETVQPCCDYRDHNNPCGCDCPEHPIGAQHPNGWPETPNYNQVMSGFADPSSHWRELERKVRDGEAHIVERAELIQAAQPLTFFEVSRLNLARCKRWHPGFPLDDTWTLADWSNAMCGEAGETANVVKKLRRHETGLRGVLDKDPDGLLDALADEIADVFCYLDLLAAKAGIDLPAAIAKKFNEVSDRQGFPEKIRSSAS